MTMIINTGFFSFVRELVLKDIKVRYRRPFLGFFWAVCMPLFSASVLYVVFSVFLTVRTAEAPFFLYLMTGVFTWRFFQDSLTAATVSLVESKQLLRETSVHHVLVPLAAVLAQALVFLPGLLLLVAVSAVFVFPSMWQALLPLVFLLHVFFAAATGVS